MRILHLENPLVTQISSLKHSIHSADGSKSMQGSHVRETTYASPSEEFSENHFTRGSAGGGETLRFLSACLSNVTFPCLPKLCLFPQHGQTVI